MSGLPDVSTCANPKCHAEFKRLGEGRLSVFRVDDPESWGLPSDLRQKVLWLCDHCAATVYLRLDRRHKTVQVVHRSDRHKGHAA